MATEASNSNSLHIVMFPFFAFGHVSPFIQLSNKLSSHGVRISFFTIPGFVPKVKTLISSSENIQIFPLEISPTLGLPANVAGTADLSLSDAPKMIKAIDLTQPQVETLLSELKPDIVLFDFAQYWLPSVASKLGIKAMQFSVFSAIASAYLTCPSRILGLEGDMTIQDLLNPPLGFPSRFEREHFVDQPQLLKTHETQDLLFLYKTADHSSLSNYDRIQKGLAGSCALVIKTCDEMEGPYLDYMKSQFKMPFILTGPLVPESPLSTKEILDENLGNWLSQFPSKSVIFCSFGSETFLAREQIRELALGLELTGQPFLLVLNFPKSADSEAELARALPLDFFERTKETGLVHVGWVPQKLILGHENVGCYFCHAGFSSIVEALMSACQLVLLPMKGDQFMNARLFGESGFVKAGVEVNTRDEDGYFGKEDVFEAVKKIMVDVDQEPGKTIRLNQRKWHNFFLNKEIQDKFISDMVVEMKRISEGI